MKKLLTLLALFLCLNISAQNTKDTLRRTVFLYSDTSDMELIYDDGSETFGKDEHCYWMSGYRIGNRFYDNNKVPLIFCIIWFYKDK